MLEMWGNHFVFIKHTADHVYGLRDLDTQVNLFLKSIYISFLKNWAREINSSTVYLGEKWWLPSLAAKP